MEPDYIDILNPIVIAVMVAYNRPVTLEEIVEGVTDVMSYLRDKMDTGIVNAIEYSAESNNGKTMRNKQKRQPH